MIPGAVPSRTLRFTDDMTELVRSSNITGDGKLTAEGGILTAESPGTNDRAYAYVPLYLPRGSVVEITCEARQMTSSSQGRISIDQHTDDSKVGGSNADYVQMDDTQWKPYKFVRSGDHKKPYTMVTFGVWLSGVGKAQYRNIVITVYNVMAPSPEYRACMIRGMGNTWIIDDSPGRFTNIGCYGLTVEDSFLRLNWSPMQSWGRPIVTAQMDQASNFTAYDVKVSGGEKHFVRLYIVNTTTGSVVKPSAVSAGTMFIGVQAIAL